MAPGDNWYKKALDELVEDAREYRLALDRLQRAQE
jgi:hypothetical protein